MKSRDPHFDFSRLTTRVGETGLHRLLDDPDFMDRELLHLELTPGPLAGPVVDCSRLVAAFPCLVSLRVWGVMGRLENAAALSRLGGLRKLELEKVFGMAAEDCLDPTEVTRLEYVDLRSIPLGYATAMRRAWRPEVPNGVYLSITGARKPEWVAQNVANPLRGWDGREGISSRAYATARAAWNQSTSTILATLMDDLPTDTRRQRLEQLGRAFALAFNDVNARTGFIETEERDELLDGLANLVSAAPISTGADRQDSIDTLLHAVNQTCSW